VAFIHCVVNEALADYDRCVAGVTWSFVVSCVCC
jgi:hypothetical protein